jgi:hypothetical protein
VRDGQATLNAALASTSYFRKKKFGNEDRKVGCARSRRDLSDARHPDPAVAVFGNGQTRDKTSALQALGSALSCYR